MADKPPIEIWPKLHELAEQNVAQARTTYGQFTDFIAQTLAASNVMPIPLFSGFRTIQERSIEYARENAERFFTLESELARAKDMQEALMLQSAYVQTQMKAYALQARELGRRWLSACRQSVERLRCPERGQKSAAMKLERRHPRVLGSPKGYSSKADR